MQLNIVFEDDALLAVNKPASLHSTMNSSSKEPSLAQAIVEKYPKLERVGKKREDAGLVQRLDFETSGIILAAKTKKVWEVLHDALTGGKVQKLYAALVCGKFAPDKTETVFIGSPYRRAKKVRVSKRRRSRYLEATSQFKLIAFHRNQDTSLVSALIGAGRRHQIRAHLSWLGFPLMGDTLYGSKRTVADVINKTPGLPEFLLHARSISFVHPLTKRSLFLEAELPEYFREFL